MYSRLLVMYNLLGTNKMSTGVKEEVSEEVKKLAFEKMCQIKIYQIYLLAEVINLASTRGAFKGNEQFFFF